jgi:hypothetical protein
VTDPLGDDMTQDTLALLSRLTDYAEQSETALAKVTNDVQKMRDERYKPYLTTMGAFIAIFVTALGYVYSMENRLTDSLFKISENISEIRSYERINEDRIRVLDERLTARSKTMTQRWNTHQALHERIDQGTLLLSREVVELLKQVRDAGKAEE